MASQHMQRPSVMIVAGTRPEGIKLAPVIQQLKACPELSTHVVTTAQHRAMLDQVLRAFDIEPDHDLDLMRPGQSLTEITVRALQALDETLARVEPDLVLVQGDTTTAFVGGLAAFYRKIAVGHVEAGLRTRRKYNPYPEELNRQFLGVLADRCFAPTPTAEQALLAEGIEPERILVTGNTVIDALLEVSRREHVFNVPELRQVQFGAAHRTLLVTVHRRESFGAPMRDTCLALRDLLESRSDLQLVFPVHLNPKVREVVFDVLGGHGRAVLLDPLDYVDFVHVMKQVDLIVTDSGGVQEEAPALGKPVLVVRETTERPEAVMAGTARLIGTARKDIVAQVSRLLDDKTEYAKMQRAINPYGDGEGARRTLEGVLHFFGLRDAPPQPFPGIPGLGSADGLQQKNR